MSNAPSNATGNVSLRDELVASGLATLNLARQVTLKYLDGIEGDGLVTRACEGGQHALHIMGHLAYADTLLLGEARPELATLPDGFTEAFGQGSVIKDSLSDYPPVAEVLRQFNDMRARSIDLFQSLDEAALLKPLEGHMSQFGRNIAHVAHTMAWHEGVHAGQLTQIRRKLGLPVVI